MRIPDERLLKVSTEFISPCQNRCYIEYDKNVTSYIHQYMALSRVLPTDVIKHVLQYTDPRKSVHRFSAHQSHYRVRSNAMNVKQCYRCRCLVVV